MTHGMPRPAVTVGDLIESLKELPPDARIALVEVQQEWSYLEALPITTLTLKVWGGLNISGDQRKLPKNQPARIA